MYDKKTETSKLLPIKQVAQEAGFYDDEVENTLNQDVEKPGNNVIDKIRRGEQIDDTDRLHLTYYIGTMIRRVPRARDRAYDMVPEVLAGSARRIKAMFEQEAQAGRIDTETLGAKLAEADEVENRFRDRPPSEVTKLIEEPWPFARWLMVIYSMRWRITKCEGPSYFLTSDNPVHLFEAYGLGNLESELAFPLCQDMLLHCSWQRGTEAGVETGAITVPSKIVKEFNRRTSSHAARFVFYHQGVPWVFRAGQNQDQQLNRINWNHR
jgi:hypothetical protein